MSNDRNSAAGITLESVIKWSTVPVGLWIVVIIQASENKNYDLVGTLFLLLPVLIGLVALVLWMARGISRACQSAFRAWQQNAPERERRRQEARARSAELQENRHEQRAAHKQHRDELSRQRLQRNQVAMARQQVERFYQANGTFFADACPPALFQASLEMHFPVDVTSVQAWKAARDIIAELTPLVSEGKRSVKEQQDHRRKQAEHRREVDRQIESCQGKIAQLKRSNLDAELIEDEIQGQEQQIKQLREQRRLLEKE